MAEVFIVIYGDFDHSTIVGVYPTLAEAQASYPGQEWDQIGTAWYAQSRPMWIERHPVTVSVGVG